MSLTEAIHFHNSKVIPTEKWMKMRYSHYSPSYADYKVREEYRKRLDRKTKGIRAMKDLFG